MAEQAETAITGGTAAEIADSVRDLIESGILVPGDPLPPVRVLARRLEVNRNTVVAAYGLLARSGAVIGQGRAGTRVAEHTPMAQEGYVATGTLRDVASGTLRDVGTGNPAAELIPDLSTALHAAVGRPVLYGEPVIDRGLEAWARDWIAPDVPSDFQLTVTSGAVDAVERLLAQALTRDDAVALEDPCFLASIQVTRFGGYRAVAVPVDDEGMTVDGLRAAEGLDWHSEGLRPAEVPELSRQTLALQRGMSRWLGICREGAELSQAVAWFASLSLEYDGLEARSPEMLDFFSRLQLGSLMAWAALRRRESRGAHYRSDFPETLAAWRCHVADVKKKNAKRIGEKPYGITDVRNGQSALALA